MKISQLFTATQSKPVTAAVTEEKLKKAAAAANEQLASAKTKTTESKGGLIQLCAVFSVICTLLSNQFLDRSPAADRADATEISGVTANAWADVVESAYASSVTFYVEGKENGNRVAWAGSGVVISPDGYILTNDHVAGDSTITLMEVTLNDGSGKTYEAALVAADPANDVALVRIKTDRALTYARIGNSDALRVGDDVIAVGNPLGEYPDTVSNGIISYVNREIEVNGRPGPQTVLQITAPISAGNSGGGLFNYRGELVGLVNAGASAYLQSDWSIVSAENIAFAVPVNYAIALCDAQIIGPVIPKTVTLGFSTSSGVLDGEESADDGAYITEIERYGAAWYAGLRVGDRIDTIGGEPVTGESDIRSRLACLNVGDPVKVGFERDGRIYTLTIETMRAY